MPRGKSVANFWLVVGTPSPLKNDGVKVSWDDEIPNMMGKIIHSCSKPPTSIILYHGFFPVRRKRNLNDS